MKKIGEFAGMEMNTQCQYCKYDSCKCKAEYKLFSYRYGFRLCPDRIDQFFVDYDDLGIEINDRQDVFLFLDGEKKFVRPYMQPVTIYLDRSTLEGVYFLVKYHKEYIRNYPKQEMREEITELICEVIKDSITPTSIKDTFCNH